MTQPPFKKAKAEKNKNKQWYQNQAKRTRGSNGSANLNILSGGQLLAAVKGKHGCFVSCDQNKEKLAIQHSKTFLNEVISNLPEFKSSLRTTNLDEELAQLKDKDLSGSEYLEDAVLVGKCIFFVPLKENIDAYLVVKKLLHDIESSGKQVSSTVRKVVPIENICEARIDNVSELLKNLLDSFFDKLVLERKETITYGFSIRRRFNDDLKRDELVTKIGHVFDEVAQKHNIKISCDLTDPEVCVLVEVCKNFCGACLVPDRMFSKMHKFNIWSAAEISEKTSEQAS